MLGGLWIVVASFIRLPFAYVWGTKARLVEIGARGGLPAGRDEELPFLNWLLVAGRILIAAVALGIAAVFAVLALLGLRQGVGPFLGGLVTGLVAAFVWVWGAGLALESLSLTIVIANNTREMVHLLRGRTGEQAAQP
jgi:hypothetical protein